MSDYSKYKVLADNEEDLVYQRPSLRLSKFYIVIIFLMMLFIGYLEYESFKSVDFSDFQAKKITRETFMRLKNIIDEEKSLIESDGNKIFFIESHLESERSFQKHRQACSIEAAARMNPEFPVYLIFTSDTKEVKLNHSQYTDILQTYDNVKIRYANVYEMGAGTVLQDFMNNNEWKKSEFMLEHMSDIIRALAVYRYGGLYMDLDCLILKPWRYINQMNFLCPEHSDLLGNSIYNFDTKTGRKFMQKVLEEFRDNYVPNEYAKNGPMLFTKIAKQLCPSVKIDVNITQDCDFITVFSRNLCFPLTPGEYRKFYQSDTTGEVIDIFRGAYFTHIWNRMQDFAGERFDRISLDSWAPYLQLARTFCPRVYDTLDEYFK